MILATFVHVSDLHFLGSAFNVNDVLYQMKFPWLDGLLGHSPRALDELQRFFGDQKGAKLIVTGDLTTKGRNDQYDQAKNFLGDTVKLPGTQHPTGLQVKNWMDYAISGNHDLWPGSLKFMSKKMLQIAQAFAFLPAHAVVQTTSPSAPPLRLLRINTDAQVSRFKRVFAVGSFVSQLKNLSQQLSALGAPRKEIRVLCLHHSPLYSGVFSSFIDSASKIELENFIENQNISVLLTGHIHQPPLVKICQTNSGRAKYLEARCGTTSQIEANEPFIKTRVQNLIGTRPPGNQKLPHNSLLLHNLKQDANGDIYWETDLLFFEHLSGFKSVRATNNTHLKNRMGEMLVDDRIKVWSYPPA